MNTSFIFWGPATYLTDVFIPCTYLYGPFYICLDAVTPWCPPNPTGVLPSFACHSLFFSGVPGVVEEGLKWYNNLMSRKAC